MNCRNAQDLLLAERDGVLTGEQRAALDAHVAACPACQRQRTAVGEAMEAVRAEWASAPLPDRDEAWQDLRVRLHPPAARKTRRRGAPLLWLGAPLAAAIALLLFRPVPPPVTAVVAETPTTASADYVELSDARATPMVYVDDDSGWLVVWAVSDAPAGGKG